MPPTGRSVATDDVWAVLDARFSALLQSTSDQLSDESRGQARHYWEYREWELAADYVRGLELTPFQQAELASLLADVRTAWKNAQDPWWKRILRG